MFCSIVVDVASKNKLHDTWADGKMPSICMGLESQKDSSSMRVYSCHKDGLATIYTYAYKRMCAYGWIINRVIRPGSQYVPFTSATRRGKPLFADVFRANVLQRRSVCSQITFCSSPCPLSGSQAVVITV